MRLFERPGLLVHDDCVFGRRTVMVTVGYEDIEFEQWPLTQGVESRDVIELRDSLTEWLEQMGLER